MNHFTKITLNFLSIVLLVSLIAAPIYFATSFAKVAGVKNASKYLIVSQVDKFPNLTLSQTADLYKLTFSKIGESQAFLDILIINNPTTESQTYTINVSKGDAKIFFGHDIANRQSKISTPAGSSVPISLYSQGGTSDQFVEFSINY
ncbi:hypothetical protein A2870_04535 [Candidatus Curtissbacteria bacterium RIFCSPHIGHO2_01_FULL_41_11]|uniref:DUF1616 domain-containing protein n=1 Tax=Candidatus Curtissbacteria bacterium RIFCSPHIGHO2_01_FULL_41_11 TaxID=1797711 RepID=A0A1F5G863_9BACT|nr:MAG: hypothetical protein A2870_04535 [Candidatus Curtissbacteria bacterium RIFCSPHIGHO2_01_FULL_41_11]